MSSRWSAVVLVLALCAASGCRNAQQYYDSGNQYVAQGKFADAVLQYRNATAKDPNFRLAHFTLAETYARLGQPAGALKEYVYAADVLPENTAAQLKAGTWLLLARRFEESRTRAERVLKVDPTSAIAQVALGQFLAGSGRQAEAEASFRKAHPLVAPDSMEAYGLLAQTAQAGLPAAPEVTDTLGWVYYKKRQPAQAIPYLRDLVEKDPLKPDYLYHLGMARVKSGDLISGRRSLQRALELGRPFAGADEARRTLASLQ